LIVPREAIVMLNEVKHLAAYHPDFLGDVSLRST
jgi:hypothetical protein